MKKFYLDGVMNKKYIVQLPTDDLEVIRNFQLRFEKTLADNYPFMMVPQNIWITEVKPKAKLKKYKLKKKPLLKRLITKFYGGKK